MPKAKRKKPKVGQPNEEKGGGWFWKVLLGAAVGAIGVKLVERVWPSKPHHMTLPPLKIPPGMIDASDYDCFLTADGGKVVCVPKTSPWPWQAGNE